MILISLALILVSGALLGAGILRGEDALVIGSILASLLAAGALFAGIRKHRQALARRSDPGGAELGAPQAAGAAVQPRTVGGPSESERYEAQRVPVRVSAGAPSAPERGAGFAQPDAADRASVLSAVDLRKAAPGAVGATAPGVAGEPLVDAPTEQVESDPGPAEERPLDDPPDEPPAELLMASELARVAELDREVLVVDGRPRYHLAGCAHLADKSAQGLPAAEAIELGFTACSMCTAATTMLGQVSRS